jgi:hypothetical protein
VSRGFWPQYMGPARNYQSENRLRDQLPKMSPDSLVPGVEAERIITFSSMSIIVRKTCNDYSDAYVYELIIYDGRATQRP